MTDEAAFLAVLDGLGLPHRQNLGKVKRRHGARSSRYYGWSVVEIDGARPILPGQVGAFWFNDGPDPDLLPPKSFQAFIAGGAARATHAVALAALTARFGPPQMGKATNTLAHFWRFGHAALRITTWPPELNHGLRIPAHDLHPELAHFCHVQLTNGYRLALADAERKWIEKLMPIEIGERALPKIRGFDSLWDGAGAGVFRWLPKHLRTAHKAIGMSADASALVGVEADEVFVLPRALVKTIVLTRLHPARGSGGAELQMEYIDLHTSDQRRCKLTILTASEPQGLNREAAMLAYWAGAPLKIDDVQDD